MKKGSKIFFPSATIIFFKLLKLHGYQITLFPRLSSVILPQ